MSNNFIVTALSIRQPWAELLVKGIKSIEIRTWAPPAKNIGKRILIHTGKSKSDTPDEVLRMTYNYNLYQGAFIGSAVLAGFREYNEYSRWVIDQNEHLNPVEWFEEGIYGFRFIEQYEFEQPIPFKGQLNFFEVNLNDIVIPGYQNNALLLGL